jgi:hypothetical protein
MYVSGDQKSDVLPNESVKTVSREQYVSSPPPMPVLESDKTFSFPVDDGDVLSDFPTDIPVGELLAFT